MRERTSQGRRDATSQGPAAYFRKLVPYHRVASVGWRSRCRPCMATKASTALAMRCQGFSGSPRCRGKPAASPSPRALPVSRQMEAKGRVSRRSQVGSEHHLVARRMDLQGSGKELWS